MRESSENQHAQPFDRVFFEAAGAFKQIGTGHIGGKGSGLREAREIIRRNPYSGDASRIAIEVPSTVVIGSNVFEAFMQRNELYEAALSDSTDERIAHRFIQGNFPVEYVGDLRSVVENTSGHPLAVRSSSLLEDAVAHPFAGVYQTKMIPNNHPAPATRFQRLLEAIKYVYASTFFQAARNYVGAIGKTLEDERMAVVIQEVVGRKHGDRYYPELSGVCRSYNFYRIGAAKPEEGVVNLALGLGKSIVDGGVTWSYSPAHPRSRPPFASASDTVKNTQLHFWAVNVGPTPAYDPTRETEFLTESDLQNADYDGTLKYLASTFDPDRDRLVPGIGVSGARVLDFAPLLQLEQWPVNDAIQFLLRLFESEMATPVEVEFALSFSTQPDGAARLAVLQVRPMLVSAERVDIPDTIRDHPGLLVHSGRVLGNGRVDGIRDVVYVKRDSFERRLTRQIAREVESVNRALLGEKRPYVLIGYGRWGSSDPWLGIPVDWGQISGAAVIVEATLPDFDVEPSQGTHFFHNIASFKISYFFVHHETDPPVDWGWLEAQSVVRETDTTRHVELEQPVAVLVDGRGGVGAIFRGNIGSQQDPDDKVTGQ